MIASQPPSRASSRNSVASHFRPITPEVVQAGPPVFGGGITSRAPSRVSRAASSRTQSPDSVRHYQSAGLNDPFNKIGSALRYLLESGRYNEKRRLRMLKEATRLTRMSTKDVLGVDRIRLGGEADLSDDEDQQSSEQFSPAVYELARNPGKQEQPGSKLFNARAMLQATFPQPIEDLTGKNAHFCHDLITVANDLTLPEHFITRLVKQFLRGKAGQVYRAFHQKYGTLRAIETLGRTFVAEPEEDSFDQQIRSWRLVLGNKDKEISRQIQQLHQMYYASNVPRTDEEICTLVKDKTLQSTPLPIQAAMQQAEARYRSVHSMRPMPLKRFIKDVTRAAEKGGHAKSNGSTSLTIGRVSQEQKGEVTDIMEKVVDRLNMLRIDPATGRYTARSRSPSPWPQHELAHEDQEFAFDQQLFAPRNPDPRYFSSPNPAVKELKLQSVNPTTGTWQAQVNASTTNAAWQPQETRAVDNNNWQPRTTSPPANNTWEPQPVNPRNNEVWQPQTTTKAWMKAGPKDTEQRPQFRQTSGQTNFQGPQRPLGPRDARRRAPYPPRGANNGPPDGTPIFQGSPDFEVAASQNYMTAFEYNMPPEGPERDLYTKNPNGMYRPIRPIAALPRSIPTFIYKNGRPRINPQVLQHFRGVCSYCSLEHPRGSTGCPYKGESPSWILCSTCRRGFHTRCLLDPNTPGYSMEKESE